ncbi:tyrosine protein phosphatase [Loigolactobacillus bifermentans]|nr:tyrosine protein phosphatase [Loigolactobacillus bifermentans]
MAREAVREGITHILVTPHHLDGEYVNHKQDVLTQTAAFQTALATANIPLTVFPGQEVHLNGNLLQAIASGDVLFADTGNRYLMLEFPHQAVPAYAQQMIFDLQSQGIVPVIVHPERNVAIQQDPQLLYDFVSAGCLTQLTASSYLGVFGEHVETFTQQIIDAGMGYIFASDAHNLKGRNFRMDRAFAKLTQHNGQAAADLMAQHAKQIINGEPVAPNDFQMIQTKKKKRFFFF